MSVIFGVLLAVWPNEGLLALVWITRVDLWHLHALVWGHGTASGLSSSEGCRTLERMTEVCFEDPAEEAEVEADPPKGDQKVRGSLEN